jgi:hypothetical protein
MFLELFGNDSPPQRRMQAVPTQNVKQASRAGGMKEGDIPVLRGRAI